MSEIPPPAPMTPPTQPGFLHPPVQINTSLAVTALVCGILGVVMCPPVGIVGIITGAMAISRCNARPQEYGGRGMAIAGLVCGICSIVTLLIMGFVMVGMMGVMVPSLSRARELSKRLVCASNMKAITTSMTIYHHEFPGQGSPSLQLLVDRGDLGPNTLICPSAGAPNYVLTWPEGVSLPATAVVIHEPSSNHDGEGGNVATADGIVRFLEGSEYNDALKNVPGP